MMMIKKLPALFLFCLLYNYTLAQYNYEYSNELWISGIVQKKLDNKATTISFEEGWRTRNFNTSLNLYTDISVDHKLNDFIKLGAGYRYSARPSIFQIYASDHRFTFDFSAKTDNDVVNFGYRQRIQLRAVPSGNAANNDGGNFQYSRNSFHLEFNLSEDFLLHASYEFFWRISGIRKIVDENRYQLEGELKINKHNKINVFYMLQQEIQVRRPDIVNTFGIGYTHSL